MNNSMSVNFKTALAIIKRKPWFLCGIILLGELLTALASVFGVIPLISLPIAWTLEVGLCMLCLKSVRNQDVSSKDLFGGFNNFKHVACGMAWKNLWVCIWLIVPVYVFIRVASGMIVELFKYLLNAAIYGSRYYSYGSSGNIESTLLKFGILAIVFWIALIVCMVFSVIKSIHYSFTPYILTDKPEIHSMDAIKVSKEMTRGLRGGIFGAVVIPVLVVFAVDLVLSLFAMIPFIGIIFSLINFVFNLGANVFLIVFINLVMASYYNNAAAGVPAPGAIPMAYYNQIPNGGYNGYNPYPNQAPNAGNTQPPINGAAQPGDAQPSPVAAPPAGGDNTGN